MIKVRLLDRDREGVVGGGPVVVREHRDACLDAVHDPFPAFPLDIRVDGVHLQVAEVGDLRGAVIATTFVSIVKILFCFFPFFQDEIESLKYFRQTIQKILLYRPVQRKDDRSEERV